MGANTVKSFDTIPVEGPAQSVSSVDEVALSSLLLDIKKRRAEFKKQRYISQDVIESLQKIGLYGAFVPRELGGSPISPTEFMKIIERISVADGSTGWVASFAFATKYLCSLPEASLQKIFKKNPGLVFAGATFPIQPAEKVDGGIIVNGRWPFGSGCMNSSLVAVGVSVPGNGEQVFKHMAVIPRDKITIDETWDTFGMTATGSHTMVVENVFVPDDMILLRDAPTSIEAPEYLYPTVTLAAQVLAVCGLGTARAAINHIIEVAENSKSITGAPTLGDRVNVQIHIAECEAKLQSARSWFYATTDEAWDAINQSGTITREQNLALRLSASHAARTGAEVARMCFEMVGTMGIFNSNPLNQYLTDSMVTAQHAFLTEGSFMNAGKVMFGKPYIPGYV